MSCFYFVTILSAIIYSEIMMFSISNFSIILQISCENFIDRNVIRDCNLNMYCVFCNMSIVCYLRNFHLGQFFIFSYPKKNHSVLHVSLLYHLKKIANHMFQIYLACILVFFFQSLVSHFINASFSLKMSLGINQNFSKHETKLSTFCRKICRNVMND